MPIEHARRHEKNGRGFFVDGRFRFLLTLEDLALKEAKDSTRTQCEWHVRPSAGFHVLQAEMALTPEPASP